MYAINFFRPNAKSKRAHTFLRNHEADSIYLVDTQTSPTACG
jgi:hypothetical protein